MKKKAKIISMILVMACIFTMVLPSNVEAATIKICKKSKTMYVGDSYTLYVVGTSEKAKWSSSNKKVATVSSKGKIKAKKVGKCTIKAKIGKKTYSCKLTVKKAGKTLTKEQAKDRIEAACRAHGLVSYPEYVNQLIAAGEYDESERAELMSWVHEASWFQTKVRIDGIGNGDYYPSAFDGSSAYTIEYVREDSGYYIFTCYRY